MSEVKMSLTRRSFISGTAAGSVIALIVPVGLSQAIAQQAPPTFRPKPQSFIRIDKSGIVTFLVPTCEMGQGTQTGQAQILAEELGADWSKVVVEMPTQPAPDYRMFGSSMGSFGSNGIRFWHDHLRYAAAQAREMLTRAAAERLRVDLAAFSAENSYVLHEPSGTRSEFGELVEEAMSLPLPEKPSLRPESERTLTGRTIRRLDTPAKVTGKAIYSIDVKRPGLLYGAVRLAPVFTSDVESFDASSVSGMPGVVAVVRVPRGAVIVARSWWQAKQAADALDIKFTRTPADNLTTDDIDKMLREALDRPDVPVTTVRGNAAAARANAGREVEADYYVPMLAHVCMEPISCTAESNEQRTEVWVGTQGQDGARLALERVLQIPADRLFINTTFLGGGFGRKSHAQVVTQAVIASRAVGGRPVKVLWTREDDVQQGLYRPTMMCHFKAVLDEGGKIAGMYVRLAGPQMGRAFGVDPERTAKATGNLANFDPLSLSGLSDLKYAIPNLVIEHAVVDLPITFSPWRSIGHSFTGFFLESFIDECAFAAGRDPLEFRRDHCADEPRMLAVLNRVAEMSGWNEPPQSNLARGVAVVESYGSYVAQVVEVRIEDNAVTVERVHAAIDCGRAINPGQVEAQIQGSVIDALGAALNAKITIRDGKAEQSNFFDYPLLTIREAPTIDVSIVEIGSPLGGAGEPGVPPLAPALSNAIFAARGRRVRSLPVLDNMV